MATERIDIVVTEKGTREVTRNLAGIGAGATKGALAVTKLQGALQNLIGTVVALGALVLGGGALVGYANTFVALQNRIRQTTRTTAGLAVVTDELFGVAQRTRSSIEATTELYVRASLATKDLGRSQRETINFTESLNQAVILSGASTQEATNGIIQLSQGLASGTLRGDELRAVLEQLPAVADIIANHMGITRGELRRLGFQGKITAEIILDAFKASRQELAERFQKTVLTLDQSLTVLRNTAIQFFGQLDQRIGVTRALSGAVKFLSDNVELLARIAFPALIVVVSTVAVILIPQLIRVLLALFAVIAAHPIGLLIVALTTAAAALAAFSDKIFVTADKVVSLDTFISTAFNHIARNIGEKMELASNFFLRSIDRIRNHNRRVTDQVKTDWLEIFIVIGREVDKWANGVIFAFSRVLVAFGQDGDEFFRNFRSNIAGHLQAIMEESRAAEAAAAAAAERDAAERARALRDLERLGTRRVAAPQDDNDFDRAEFMARLNREIQQNTDLLRLNSREREIQAQINAVSNELLDNGTRLLEEERIELEDKLRFLELLNRRTEAQDQITRDLTEAQEALIFRQRVLNDLIAEAGPLQEQYNRMLEETNLEILRMRVESGQGSIADSFLFELSRMTEGARNFRATAGATFASFFNSIADGAARAFGQAIAYGEDLGDALMQVARQAVAELIAAFVKLAIQWVINATIGTAVQEASTAASIVMAEEVAAAWATAATAVSLASYGANAGPAVAAMVAAYAAGAALAAVPGFATGGLVDGQIGRDTIPARLTRGEFVVNPQATRRNLDLLRAMNDNQSVAAVPQVRAGDIFVNNETSIVVQSDDPEKGAEAGRQAAEAFRKGVVQILAEQKRPGGMLSRGFGNSITG